MQQSFIHYVRQKLGPSRAQFCYVDGRDMLGTVVV